MAEVVVPSAERDHQVIVGQRFRLEHHFALRNIQIEDLVEQDSDILLSGKNRADGLCNFRRGKPGRGDLIKQRLEKVMIRAIHHRHQRITVFELLAKSQPAESGAEHNHMGGFFLHSRLIWLSMGKLQWQEGAGAFPKPWRQASMPDGEGGILPPGIDVACSKRAD